MSRPCVRVRAATQADLPDLLQLADALRDQVLPSGATGSSRPAPAARAAMHTRYLEALADPDRHLVVAVDESDVPLGMALFTVASANALLDQPALHMSHAVVADAARRRGAGKALVAAAAAFAEEHGLEQIVASVHPGSREANRFFARLGFAPLAVRRVASVAVVKRRLPHPEVRSSDAVGRPRVRRSRLGLRTIMLPLGPATPAEPGLADSPPG